MSERERREERRERKEHHEKPQCHIHVSFALALTETRRPGSLFYFTVRVKSRE